MIQRPGPLRQLFTPAAVSSLPPSTTGTSLGRLQCSLPRTLHPLTRMFVEMELSEPDTNDLSPLIASRTHDQHARYVADLAQHPDRFRAWVLALNNLMLSLPAPHVSTQQRFMSFTLPVLALHADPCMLLDDILRTFLAASHEATPGHRLAGHFCERLLSISGITEDTARKNPGRVKWPSSHRDADPAQLADAYFSGTPLADQLNSETSISIPDYQPRFAHHWICGGAGHGKTQCIQNLLIHDFSQVAKRKATIIVIDSQGDLISKISRLKIFAPGCAFR